MGETPGAKPKIDTMPSSQQAPKGVPASTDARLALSDEPATGVTQPPEATQAVDTPKAGLLHEKLLKYHEQEFKEKAAEVIENDRKKLADSEITDIRGNSRILVEKNKDEPPLEQVLNLKKETARRLRAYTDEADNEWYKLNYERLGSDKNGLSHEFNVGLGDILLDPDIKDVLVFKQDGTLVKAHRGVVPDGYNHAGRLGFLNESKEYVATFTGDKFRILSSNETVNPKDPKTIEKYLAEYQQEEKIRETDKGNFEQQIMLDEVGAFNFNKEKGDKSQPVSDAKIIEKLNAKRAENDGQQIFDYAKECCEKFGIRWSVFKELIQVESVWSPEAAYKGPVHSDASGLGQFLGSTWDGFMRYCTTNNVHDEKWGQTMDRNTRFNPYASLYATAWLMSKTRGAFLNFDEKNVAEQGLIYYICHHEGLAGGKKFLKKTAAGHCPKRDVLALANRIAYRASITENFDFSTIEEQEVAFRIEDGQEGANGKGILKLRSNQNTWIFGSSGVVGMHDLRNKIDFGNTGFFGIVGINPMGFRDRLKTEWPKIANLKLPNQIILAEMAGNGLGSNDEGLIQKNLEAYADIKKFLEEKGVQEVKISTVQPMRGREKQIATFNEKIKEKYGDDCIDINFKAEYAAADGIHLNKEGYEEFARKVKERRREWAKKIFNFGL